MEISGDLDNNIKNLKDSVRKSFANIYASLKARELKTLRQLDAIRKHCEDDKELTRNYVRNVKISYDIQPTLLNNINNFGEIDFERLNFDSNAFTLEDYISPNDDHMYSYKCIEDLDKDEDLGAIEEAALKQITSTDNCVCFVNICSKDVSKKFRDVELKFPNVTEKTTEPVINCQDDQSNDNENMRKIDEKVITNCTNNKEIIDSEENKEIINSEVKKVQPTDDWLKSIKDQIETEPTQCEHSTITCS